MTGIAILAAVLTVEIAMTDGTKTSETVDVAESNGVVRFVWPKEKVPANFKRVTVTPDFATARKGEDGYWVMPNNMSAVNELLRPDRFCFRCRSDFRNGSAEPGQYLFSQEPCSGILPDTGVNKQDVAR